MRTLFTRAKARVSVRFLEMAVVEIFLRRAFTLSRVINELVEKRYMRRMDVFRTALALGLDWTGLDSWT